MMTIVEKKNMWAATLLAAIVTVIIGVMIAVVITDELDVVTITNLFVEPIDYFCAEKSEKLQYMICTVSYPILFFLFFLFFQKKHPFNSSKSKIDGGVVSICLATVITAVALGSGHYIYFGKYITGMSGGYGLLVGWITNVINGVAALFLSYYFIFKKHIIWGNSKVHSNVIKVVGIIYILLMALLHYQKYYDINYYLAHHFEAFFYPVYRVYSGQTIGVDFHNLYGFYPYLLLPITLFFGAGTLSEQAFGCTMVLLVIICYICIFGTVWTFIKNKVLAAIVSLAISFVSCLYILIDNSYYFQYVPHRLLFPAVMLFIIGRCISFDCKKRFWIQCGYVVAAIGFFYNIDTGAVAALVWIIFLCFHDVMAEINIKDFILRLLTRTALLVCCVATVFALLNIYTYNRGGKWLIFNDVLFGQSVFYHYGFYMLKMPLFHPWMLLVIVYMVALAKGISRISWLVQKEVTQQTKIYAQMYFILAVMGMGLFSYYQGRSHDVVMGHVVWPVIFILGLFVQELLEEKQEYTKKTSGIKAFLLTAVCIYMAFNAFTAMVRPDIIPEFKWKVEDKASWRNDIAEFINDNCEGEKVDILLYAGQSFSQMDIEQTIDYPIQCLIDCFTKQDYQEVIEYMQISSNKIVISESAINRLRGCDEEKVDETLCKLHLLAEKELDKCGRIDTLYIYSH